MSHRGLCCCAPRTSPVEMVARQDAKSPGAQTPGLLVVGLYRLGGQATNRFSSTVQLTPS